MKESNKTIEPSLCLKTIEPSLCLIGAAGGAAAVKGGALIAKNGTLVGKVGTALAPTATLAPNLGNKLDYIFGKAQGNIHNIQRSTQMYEQLNSIGIFDNDFGRAIITNTLTNVLNNPNSVLTTQNNGRVVRECLVVGQNGILKMQSIWEGVKLITVNLFGK